VFQPNVYKDARPELSKAAGEVKRLVSMQLDPGTSSQYTAAILAQLIYDSFDTALKVIRGPAIGSLSPLLACDWLTASSSASWNSLTNPEDKQPCDRPSASAGVARLATD
jgi:hypothetical protein